MASVGTETVEVVPDARRFKPLLDAQLRDLKATVRLAVDTGVVSAKIDEIKAKIDTITGRARIDLDTGSAAVKIAALKAEIDSIRDKHINVDDGGSASRTSGAFKGIQDAASAASIGSIARFAAIGAGLLALIPLAAAASIAIAGIGLGIGIGVLGLLVGGLALGGVGAAVKAGSTPGQGAQSGQQQAQAQQAIVAAVQAHKQAIISLSVAERDAAQAEKDLTQARIDAAQNLQNLTNAVADNRLAQRQAALDVASAALNLKIANANPDAKNPANTAALAAVQLAFDQAKQNQLELAEAGKQAAAASAKANTLGVSGARNVVDAQHKVVDTTNAVAQAQFNVADTAQKIALAQQSAANQTSAFGTALKKLDPAQKAFAAFLLSLKPVFDTIKSAVTTGFLPLLQKAITSLLPVMPQIAVIVGEIARGFGELAVKAAGFFTSPDGQKFLTFIQNNIGPAIATFGSIFGGLFQIAAGFFQQAYPLIQSFGDAVSGALGSANGGVQGGALSGFFDYIKTNEPQIKQTLKDVGGALVSVFKSFAPLAGPALKLISELAKDIAAVAKVAAPVIQALIPFAPLILILVGAFKLLAPIMAIINALVAANPFVLLGLAVLAVVAAFIYAYTHFKTFRDIVNDILNYGIKPLINYLVTVAKVEIKIFADTWKITWDAIKVVYNDVIKPIFDGIKTAISAIPGIFKTVKSAIVGAWSDIWNGMAGIVSAAFHGVTSVIVDVMNGIITAIDGVIKVINDAIDVANAAGSVIGVHIGHIPKIGLIDTPTPKGASSTYLSQVPHAARAAGGPVDAGKPYLVGELGPEMFTPKTNGMIFSNADLSNGRSGKSAGGTTVVQNIHGGNLSEIGIANAVSRRLQFAGA